MIMIDTGPLVALAYPNDPYNDRAATALQRLRRGPLVTCVPVLAEACFHLTSPYTRANLRQLMDKFGIAIFSSGDDGIFLEGVFDWLAKYAEHEPDFADGWLAVLCGADERVKLWTFDAEFRTRWKRPNGTSIPMAVA